MALITTPPAASAFSRAITKSTSGRSSTTSTRSTNTCTRSFRPPASGRPGRKTASSGDTTTDRVTTTGSYGSGGITESREYLHKLTDRSNSVTRRHNSDGGWGNTHIRYSLTFQNHNGQISGHEYHRIWTVDENGVDVWEPVIDRDIYDGTPPSGPVGGLTYVVHSPPGEQTGAGLGGEEPQGGFQPGTIDVDLQRRAAEALEIAFDYLNVDGRKRYIEYQIRDLQDDLERGWKNGDWTFIERVDKDATRKEIQQLEQQARILGIDLQHFRNRLDRDYGDIEFELFAYDDPPHGADAIIQKARDIQRHSWGHAPHAIHSTGGPGDLLAFGMAGILKGVGRGAVTVSGAKPLSSAPSTVTTKTLAPTHRIKVRYGKAHAEYNALKADIKANGIREPIKYVEHNGTRYIVDGHHRLRAAQELGMKNVPTEKVELPFGGYKTVDDLLDFFNN